MAKLDIMLAKNAEDQEVAVLEKKRKLAEMVLDFSKKFEKRSKSRVKETSSKDEERLINDEVATLEHIKADANKLEKQLQEKRDHDLAPLLTKASMAMKMLIAREKKPDPSIFKQFQFYETAIMQKLKDDDDLKKDEFESIKHLIDDLKEERSVLEAKYQQGDKSIKKRVNETIAQQLMLENLLRMTTVLSMTDEKLRKNAVRLYNAMNKAS